MHTSTPERRQTDGTIPAQQPANAQQRRARRRAFWAGVSDLLLSIPPGIAMRIGG